MTGRQGQSTVEYAVLIAVIIAALLAVQIYVKRGAMGRLRTSTDSIGEQFNPHITEANMSEHYGANRKEEQFANGVSKSTLNADELQQRGLAAGGNAAVGYERMIDTKTVGGKLENESLFWKDTPGNAGN